MDFFKVMCYYRLAVLCTKKKGLLDCYIYDPLKSYMGDIGNRNNRKKKKKKNVNKKDSSFKVSVVATLTILLLAAAVGGIYAYNYYKPNEEMVALDEYMNVPAGTAVIMKDGQRYHEDALIEYGKPYISLLMAKELFEENFYYDENERLVVFAMPEYVVYAEVSDSEENNSIYEDESKVELSSPAAIDRAGTVYLSAEFVSRYASFKYDYYENPGRLVFTYDYEVSYLMAVPNEGEIALREKADWKSRIVRKIGTSEKLMVVNGGAMENGYINVMTEDGVTGFVKKSEVTSDYQKFESDYVAPDYYKTQPDYYVNLVFNAMSYKEGNDGAADLLKYADGVTTISPTWFRLTGNEGDITSFADSSYVDTMHAKGVDVWGLVSNFEESVDTTKILSSTSTRKKLIAKLIDEAKRVGMDGINVDFETLATECGPHYIEFIRELSASCRRNSLVLSVDNYVPAAYNAFMDCEEQGKVVDYVIIMAYDEHYAGSEEAGSVSSIGYVENGIKDMAEMVPKDKIICAIPFYTRLWKITDGVLSSEALSMRSAEETVSANDATYVWDEETAQNYAEYSKDGSDYKIWLEDADSIEEKVVAIANANIAGVAAWRLGFEKSSIWTVIKEGIK